VKPQASWQRNLAAVWIGQLFSIIGFSSVLPFMPLYVQDLGVVDPHEVELWAGLLGFAAGAAMAVTAPIWGSLADRHGRKPMLLRAAFGGAIFLGAMGLVTNVQQLVVLRFCQGAVTGVMAAANTLVASFTPRERLGFALGTLQMAIFVGNSLGPLVGGYVADHLGFRYAFFVTAALLALGGLVVAFFVDERFQRPRASGERRLFAGFGGVAREPALLVFAATSLTIHGSAMMVGPIFPLFVQDVSPSARNVASTVGLIIGVAGVVSALSALVIGRVSDRLGHRKVLAVCAVGAGFSYIPQAFSTDPAQVLVWRAALGLFAGGMMPSINALIALRAPAGMQGAAFGLNSTASAIGGAFGPLGGAWLATVLGLRAVFIAAGAALLTVGLGASLLRAQPPSEVERDAPSPMAPGQEKE
jgi:DHA1 family multidrug resistance protein-like MFS transporter